MLEKDFEMMIYFFIFLVAGCCARCAAACRRHWSVTLFSILTFFALWFPAAVRYGIGTDYLVVYPDMFRAIFYGDEPNVEWLFVRVVQCIQSLTGNCSEKTGQLIFAIVAGVTYAFLLFAIERKYWWLALLIYFITAGYTGSYNTIRQSLSATIALMSIRCWTQERYSKSLIFLGVAVGFHSSTLILLPLLLSVQMLKIPNKLLSVGLCALALFAYVIPFDQVMLKLVLSAGVYTQYDGDVLYLNAVAGSSGIGSVLWLVVGGLSMLAINNYEDSGKKRILILLVGVGMFFRVVGAKVIILDRCNVLFSVMLIFVWVELWRNSNRMRLIPLAVPAMLIMTVIFIKDLIPDAEGVAANGVIPYQSFFDNPLED